MEGVIAWIDHDREIRGGSYEMLIGHIRTKFLSPEVRLKILETNGKKKVDQMHNDKLARSGHDEILLARMATLDKKMRPSLYSFDFKVNQHR